MYVGIYFYLVLEKHTYVILSLFFIYVYLAYNIILPILVSSVQYSDSTFLYLTM